MLSNRFTINRVRGNTVDRAHSQSIFCSAKQILMMLLVITAYVLTSSVASNAAAATPSTPGNLRVDINSPTSATLSWNAVQSTEGRIRYLLTRNRASLGVRDGTTFLDNALLPDREFVYTVTAVNVSGEQSPPASITFRTPSAGSTPNSTAATATQPTSNPAPPLGLRYERYSERSLELFWQRSSAIGVRYNIYRNGQLIRQTDGTSHFEPNVDPGNTLRYEVATVDNENRESSRAPLSIASANGQSPQHQDAPTAVSAGQPAEPENPRLEIYSDSAAELFWSRSATLANQFVEVEIERDGQFLGRTDGSSYFDDSRTNRSHVYRLVSVVDNSRSNGVTLPATSNGTTPVVDQQSQTSSIPAINPTSQIRPVTGSGLDVFLLNGQSNANPQFLAALTDHLSSRGFDFITGHYFVGGQPLSTWINEDGSPALRWPIMMNVFNGVTAMCLNKPAAEAVQGLRSITLVHYQGEADVNTTNSLIAVANNAESPFKRRLSAFTREFTRHFQQRCGITPNIALAIISFDEAHSLFPARLTEAHRLIRREISEVAIEQANVGAFDTLDLPHADHVHLELYPASNAQAQAADRAVRLFFR